MPNLHPPFCLREFQFIFCIKFVHLFFTSILYLFSLSFFALSFSPSVPNRFQYLSKNQFFIWSIIAHIFWYNNIYSKYLNKNEKEKIFEDFSIQSQNFNLDKFNSSRNWMTKEFLNIFFCLVMIFGQLNCTCIFARISKQ